MLRLGSKFVTTQATIKTLALAIGIWLAYQGTAAGAACSVQLSENWLRPPIVAPADSQGIMTLIANYNSALDLKDAAGVVQLFPDAPVQITYESCDGAGNRIFHTTDRADLLQRLENLFLDLNKKVLQPRHFLSNTLLDQGKIQGKDTVRGQGTRLVTVQSGSEELEATIEYTGVLRATFTKAGDDWKFVTLRIHADTPGFIPLAR